MTDARAGGPERPRHRRGRAVRRGALAVKPAGRRARRRRSTTGCARRSAGWPDAARGHFRYDAGTRRVRAVGAHGIASRHSPTRSCRSTGADHRRALAEDAVVEVVGDLTGQAPDEFAALIAEPARLVCAPMAAGGRAIGVILADRLMSHPPLQDADRSLLWTLGKAAALASVARTVSTQSERARALEQRIDLAREIHEGVIQRLFGVSMALDGDGDLPAEARERCATETQAALSELRRRYSGRSAGPRGRPRRRSPPRSRAWPGRTRRSASSSCSRRRRRRGAGGLEPLAQSVLREAVRNAEQAREADPRVRARRPRRRRILAGGRQRRRGA